MRTTLTIDEDVAALLERVRKSKKASLRSVVNDALRQGLKEMARPPRRGKPYATRSAELGRCLLGNLDDISEALDIAEGGKYK